MLLIKLFINGEGHSQEFQKGVSKGGMCVKLECGGAAPDADESYMYVHFN